MVEDGEGDGKAPLWRRAVAWVSSHAWIATLPLVAAAAVFATYFVAVCFEALSIVRWIGLAFAPFVPQSRFRRDVPQPAMLVLHAFAIVIAEAMRVMADVTSGAHTTPAHAMSVAVFWGLGFAWFLTHVGGSGYTDGLGGLLGAYGVRGATDKVLALLAIPKLPDVEAAARTGLRVCALAAASGILLTATTAEIKTALNSPPERSGPKPDEENPSPPANPEADRYCGFDVYEAIARDTPSKVAVALAQVYGGTREKAKDEAPGARTTGCPRDKTVSNGMVFVNHLKHPKSGDDEGALVSDAAGKAAVVFPTLRHRFKELLDGRLIVGVDRRRRTRLGDAQVFHQPDEQCSLAIREYGSPYVALEPVMTLAFVRMSVDRKEIPRIATTPSKTGRTDYVLTFSSQPSTVRLAYDPALDVVVSGADNRPLSGQDKRCPRLDQFYALADASAPPQAEITP